MASLTNLGISTFCQIPLPLFSEVVLFRLSFLIKGSQMIFVLFDIVVGYAQKCEEILIILEKKMRSLTQTC